jgi:hypothetical protein
MISVNIMIGADGGPIVVCPGCGRRITHSLLNKAVPGKAISIVCSCKLTFRAARERRRNYRKRVHLPGLYFRGASDLRGDDMFIEDVSEGGIGFTVAVNNNLRVGELLRVEFTLDDSNSSRISRTVQVRTVKDGAVGAEFCDFKIDKALGFYLRP